MGKYKFSELVGNVYTKAVIQHALSSGSFPQFAIFEGTLGTGKSTMAQITGMALTCENPFGGNPCCKCRSCQSAIRALRKTGETYNIKTINLGAFEGKSDVRELIHDIFTLQSGGGTRVYILEEAHALKSVPSAQTALLNEFDRMPINTYVIMCTTRIQDIIQEIQSRGVQFKFRKLTAAESLELAKAESAGSITENVLDVVIRQSKGIPRNIIKSINFIKENNIDYDTYVEFISDVGDGTLTELFLVMTEKDMAPFMMLVDSLLETRDIPVLVRAVKDYLVRVLFYCYGAKTDFAGADMAAVKELFNDSNISRVLPIIDSMNEAMSESEFKLALFRLRMAMQGRTTKNIYAESQKAASVSKEQAKEIRAAKADPTDKILKPLDLSKLGAF